MWIIVTSREETITYQGAIDKLNQHRTPHRKSKVKVSLCRGKRYQRTYIEEINYRFYQVRPVVSHIEFHLTDKTLTPNNIGEDLKYL